MNNIQGELNRRNTATMAAKLEEMNLRIYEQDKKIVNMHSAISSVMVRLQLLESELMKIRVSSAGTGPSVK